MKRVLALVLPASLLGALGFAAPAPAATDIFLQVSGMAGESRDAKMAKSADVLSFSWGVHRAKATRARAAGGRFSDLTVTKYADRMSPDLFSAAASGQTIPSLLLTVRKAGETPSPYMRFCAREARVRSIEGGVSNGDARMAETVAFSFDKMVQEYTQISSTGSVAGVFTKGWDVVSQIQYGDMDSCGR